MCARAIDMRGEGERRGPSAELHRYRLDGRSSMGPCRRRWRKYKSRASGGNGAGRGGALLLESSAPSTYYMVVTAPVSQSPMGGLHCALLYSKELISVIKLVSHELTAP